MAETKKLALETSGFEKVTMDEVIDWCEAKGYMDWLEAEANKKVKVKKYTGRKQKLDAYGEVCLNKKGYPIYVVDKASKIKVEERPIDFMNIKKDFYAKFKAELPKDWKKESKKEKKTTFRDKIKARKAN